LEGEGSAEENVKPAVERDLELQLAETTTKISNLEAEDKIQIQELWRLMAHN